MKLARFARYAVATLAAAVLTSGTSCSGKDDRLAPAAQPAPAPAEVKPAEPPPVARPAPDTVPADFPPDCVDYAELIEKLKRCDRLGAARDSLRQAYVDLRTMWSTVPAERRDELARQCKAQADSLRSAAAAACGW